MLMNKTLDFNNLTTAEIATLYQTDESGRAEVTGLAKKTEVQPAGDFDED